MAVRLPAGPGEALPDAKDLFFSKCAKSLESCLTVCDPMDCSLPGSSVHGVLQARILDWVAFPLPEDPPDPGIEPTSLMSPAFTGRFFTTSATWESSRLMYRLLFTVQVTF